MNEKNLQGILLSVLQPELRAQLQSWSELEATLNDHWNTATAAWPDLSVTPEEFMAKVAEDLQKTEDPNSALLNQHSADLYLATSCGQGNEKAIAAFDLKYKSIVLSVLRQFRFDSATGEDIIQMIYQKLFTGDEEHPPKIRMYVGRGDLGGWLRVTAMRHILNYLRDHQKPQFAEEEILENLAAPEEDVTVQYLKKVYGKEFKACFLQAMGSLSPRERNLLRHRLLDGLTFHQIGIIYKVSQVTVFRWLADIQKKLQEETKKAFSETIKLPSEEFTSIIRMIQSRLEVSMRQILQED